MAKHDLTPERLRELFDYDPATGHFTRKAWVSRGKTSVLKKPCRAGTLYTCGNLKGYIVIGVVRWRVVAHRLAWLYVYGKWPDGDVDHVNGDRADNRIANLRDVCRRINAENKRTALAHSGLLGAYRRADGKWKSAIGVRGRRIHLGSFDTAEEAHRAYVAAKRRLHEGCTI